MNTLPACCSSIVSLLETLSPLAESTWTHAASLGIFGKDLKGINLLLLFSPKRLTFFSTSQEQLNYLTLILELIEISDCEETFISQVYSRSVTCFIQKNMTLLPFSQMHLRKARFSNPDALLKEKLTFFTQWAYLAQPYDCQLLDITLTKLSPKSRETYKKSLFPYINEGILLDEKQCQRLLPCWPLTEKVPYEEGGGLAKNAFHELEPSTCTFFYGHGWLTQKATFQAVKQRLKQADIYFELVNEKKMQPCDVFFFDQNPQESHDAWKLEEKKEQLLIQRT